MLRVYRDMVCSGPKKPQCGLRRQYLTMLTAEVWDSSFFLAEGRSWKGFPRTQKGAGDEIPYLSDSLFAVEMASGRRQTRPSAQGTLWTNYMTRLLHSSLSDDPVQPSIWNTHNSTGQHHERSITL